MIRCFGLLVLITLLSLTALASKVDSLIYSKYQKIEENDTLIIKGIESFAVSPDCKRFCLIDKSDLYIASFDSESGALLNCFRSNPDLNSTFIKKYHYFDRTSLIKRGLSLVSNGFANGIGLKSEEIKNIFEKITFLTDTSIFVSGTLYAFCIDTSNGKRKFKYDDVRIVNIATYYKFDKNLNLKYSTPLEVRESAYPVNDLMLQANDSTLICSNHDYINSIDSSVVFSEYNMDGKWKHSIGVIPNDYIVSRLNRIIFKLPVACIVKNRLFWSCLADYKIRGANPKEGFELKGFDTLNNFFWQDFANQIEKSKKNPEENFRPIIRLSMKVLNITPWKESLIAIEIKYDDEIHTQFYDMNGNLLKHIKLIPPKNQNIVSLDFISAHNKIYAVTKDEENYYIVEYNVKW